MYDKETVELALAALAEGLSLRGAAAVAGVSASCAGNWSRGFVPGSGRCRGRLPVNEKYALASRALGGGRPAGLAMEAGRSDRSVRAWATALAEGRPMPRHDSRPGRTGAAAGAGAGGEEALRARVRELELRNAVLEKTVEVLKKAPARAPRSRRPAPFVTGSPPGARSPSSGWRAAPSATTAAPAPGPTATRRCARWSGRRSPPAGAPTATAGCAPRRREGAPASPRRWCAGRCARRGCRPARRAAPGAGAPARASAAWPAPPTCCCSTPGATSTSSAPPRPAWPPPPTSASSRCPGAAASSTCRPWSTSTTGASSPARWATAPPRRWSPRCCGRGRATWPAARPSCTRTALAPRDPGLGRGLRPPGGRPPPVPQGPLARQRGVRGALRQAQGGDVPVRGLVRGHVGGAARRGRPLRRVVQRGQAEEVRRRLRDD